MIRIAGVVLPDNKKICYGLTAIYGVGLTSARKIVDIAKVDPDKKVKDINREEENRLRTIVEKENKVEGELRSLTSANIRRLKDIQSYRGIRHSRNLPVRGQRTKTNARTKRGKKVTVGSGRKKSAEKT